MQGIVLRMVRRQRMSLLAGVGLLALGMALLPQACVPLALLMPLLIAPLAGYREFWYAVPACAVPALASLFRGYDPLYSASLFLLAGLPVFTSYVLYVSGRLPRLDALGWQIGACALGLLLTVACGARAVGGYLPTGLADMLTSGLAASRQPGIPLYRLATAGFIGVPREYRSASLLTYLMEPALVRQLLLSLHLTLETQISQLLPSLFVHVSVVCGLFTGLRAQRANATMLVVSGDLRNPASRQARVAGAPGFCDLRLPRHLLWLTTGMGVASLPLALAGSPVLRMVGMLCYAAFCAVYQLVGAAVMVSALSSRNPERKPLYGMAAGALYVLFPMALLVMGMLEPILRLRRRLDDANDDEEEDDP